MRVNILPVIIFYICFFCQNLNALQQQQHHNQLSPQEQEAAAFYSADKKVNTPLKEILSDSASLKLKSSKKNYSNKEVIYGDDSDEDETEVAKSPEEQLLKNSEMFQTDDDESDDSDHLDIKSLSASELAYLAELMTALEQEQEEHEKTVRMSRAKNSEPRNSAVAQRFLDILSAFEQPKRPLEKNSNQKESSFDTQDDETYSDEEISPSSQIDLFKSAYIGPHRSSGGNSDFAKSVLSILNNDEQQMSDLNFGSGIDYDASSLEGSDVPDYMESLGSQVKQKQQSQAENKKMPVFNFKEQVYSEKDYNKQLKGGSVLPPASSSLSEAASALLMKAYGKINDNPNPINSNGLDPDLFAGMKLNLNDDLYNSKSEPSMAKQSSFGIKESDSDHHHSASQMDEIKKQNDFLFIFIVVGCVLAGLVSLIAASVCWYTVNKSANSSSGSTNIEYGTKTSGLFGNIPTGGLASSNSIKSNTSKSSGDKKLAQSAQMYHYQHQKQQMIALEKANNENKTEYSDNSDGETEEGDYTVYECPGLAPTGEMEVKNPLFKEDFIQLSTNVPKSASVISLPPSYSAINPDQIAPSSGQESSTTSTTTTTENPETLVVVTTN